MVSTKSKKLMTAIHVNDLHTLQNVLVEQLFTPKYLLECLPQETYKEVASIVYSFLSTKGALVDLEANLLVEEIHEIFTPLQYASLLGRAEMVRYMCLTKKVNVNRKHENNEAPIHLAAKSNNVETAMNLVSNFGLFVNALDNVKQTAIQLAARNGKVEMVNFLVQLPHISVNNIDLHGEGLIHILARKGEIFSKALHLLLKKPQLNKHMVNSEGETALHVAARKGHYKLVLQLIEVGLDINAGNNVGRNVLQLACIHGHENLVNILIKDPNVDLNASDMYGNTGLHSAAENCHFNVLKSLLMRNVDATIENYCGEHVGDILEKQNLKHFDYIEKTRKQNKRNLHEGCCNIEYVKNAIQSAIKKKKQTDFESAFDEFICEKLITY